jgi:hypothetical protein
MLAGGMAVRFFAGVGENAAKIDDLSNRLKIGHEELSRYQFIAERGGVEMESLATAMQRLGANSISAADGNNAAAAALNRLGIDSATFKNLGMDEQFALVADRIQGIENPAERVRLAMDLMGRGGAEMLQVMDQGGASFLEMRDRADELGVTLTKVQSQDIAAMMDAFDDVGYAAKGLAQDFLAALAPAIEWVVKQISWAISKFQVFDHGMTKIGWGIVSLGNKIGVVSDETYKFATIEAYERIHKDVKDVNASLGKQDELLKRIRGSMGGVGAGKAANSAKKDFKDLEDAGKSAADKTKEAMTDAAKSMESDLSGAINGIRLDFNDLKGSAVRALEAIGESILKNILNQQFGNSGGGGMPSLGGGGGGGFGDLISSGLGSLGDWFGGFFADGGDFSGGKPIIVGERGPEMIWPKSAGTVIPNGAGSKPISVQMNITTPDANSFRRSQSQISAAMAQAVQQGSRNL